MSSRRRAPTLRDIATLAGVSPYTVSAVLNGARSNSRVSAETRARIERHARELGYIPNAAARSLARRRTDMIGVLVEPVDSTTLLADPYSSSILHGILMEASHLGLGIAILPHRAGNDDGGEVGPYRDGRTDGLILVAPTLSSRSVERLFLLDVPTALIAYPGERFRFPSVDVDNAAGIRLAIEHLIQLGHTRIAHLAGNKDMVSAGIRRQAFVQILTERGLALPEEYLIDCCYSGNEADRATRALLALDSPPTAIVAANDAIAARAIQAAHEIGVAVPGDLSVTGFDDTMAASLLSPALTTIHQPMTQIGREAVRLLTDVIAERAVPESPRLLAPSLVVRGTTAPPTAGNLQEN